MFLLKNYNILKIYYTNKKRNNPNRFQKRSKYIKDILENQSDRILTLRFPP